MVRENRCSLSCGLPDMMALFKVLRLSYGERRFNRKYANRKVIVPFTANKENTNLNPLRKCFNEASKLFGEFH
jgi:hypothetical protein